MALIKKSKWQQEVDLFADIKTAIILEGNINDVYPYVDEETGQFRGFCPLDRYLYMVLRRRGFDAVIFFDPINGFYNHFEQSDELKVERLIPALMRAEKKKFSVMTAGAENGEAGSGDTSDRTAAGADDAGGTYTVYNDTESTGKNATVRPESPVAAAEIADKLMTGSQRRVCVVMNFSSRLVARPDDLDAQERELFMHLQYATLNAARHRAADGSFRKNLLFLICDKSNDLPAWFYINNPAVKTIVLPAPDREARAVVIDRTLALMPGWETAAPELRERAQQEFLSRTDGFKALELIDLRTLAQRRDMGLNQVVELISLYKYGVKENPWDSVDAERLAHAEEIIRRRVMGQDLAVRRAVDVIKRAAEGMSGLQHSSADAKPRGILFLAGPTGTGKTELAKAVTELIFGDESACIRFDMSEYQQPQSDQKLMGAPPGYVGYESGGQLTNAVRNHPFSTLLFDEIEKAHPSILDKFLQILDDGRMTDSHGDTVYFNECIIIFTSNLGMTRPDPIHPGQSVINVSIERDRDYQSVHDKILQGVKDYFKLELKRPELLNRIGNNILVFDFIREGAVAGIVRKQTDNIFENLQKARGIQIEMTDEARAELEALAKTNLAEGGRGIGNIVEEHLLNPLGRTIFDRRPGPGARLTIRGIRQGEGATDLECDIT